MDPKNIRLYGGNGLYFIEDQYQKDNNFDCKDTIFDCKDPIFDCEDTIFDYEDAYYYDDIDVDRILLFKSGNKHFIRYKHSNKMNIVPLQIKIKNLYYQIRNYGSGDNIICIEKTDKIFFEKMKKIWNKIIELVNINNAEDFVKYTLDDNSKFIEVDVPKNANFVKDHCYQDKFIIVIDSVINDILMASLLELRENNA